jgi:transposase-like protein
MGRKNFTPEQIIKHLREAEILIGKGNNIAQVCKKIGVSEQTYYRWRREYGGMQVEQAKRLKELEKENSRLKRLVADLNLDKAILEEALKGNY